MSQHSYRNSAFTLIEMLVCMGIVLVLAAMLFPSLKSMIANSRSAKCASNLRQIGVGMHSFANDNDGKLALVYSQPTSTLTWMQRIAPYVGMDTNALGPAPLPRAAGIFVCPEWKMDASRKVSYGLPPFMPDDTGPYSWNYQRQRVSPSKTFMVVEIEQNDEAMRTSRQVPCRHPNTSANYLFVDGHVENIRDLVPYDDPRWRPDLQNK